MNDFSIDLRKLKSNKDKKPSSDEEIRKSDNIGDQQGFNSRDIPKKRGRPASPRTGQVHARVLPHISQEISAEAQRRGVQQGVVLEEAWQLYKEKRKL